MTASETSTGASSGEQESGVPAATDLEALVASRRSLHGVAECLLAGSEYRACKEISLRVTPGGFATTGAPAIRLDGAQLVEGELHRIPVQGQFGQLADALGVRFGPPEIGYRGGSGAAEGDPVELDRASLKIITDWFLLADAALRVLATDQAPILWPEHFDVAVLLDDRSYGASPGDDFHATPYAYVSAADNDGGEFWNAPFGALLDYSEVRNIDDLVSFWQTGRRLLGAALA
jgi:hypothetical protein